MTIQECYNIIGDYEAAIKRLMNDALIKRFVLKFPADPSFSQLTESLESSDTEAAFRAAHTLKGVCGNLSLAKLYSSACEITELLRSGELEKATDYYPIVKEDYELTVNTIEMLD